MSNISKIEQQHGLAVTTPADLLRLAIEKGADLDRLEKLMDLQVRWEANESRKAYVEAMAEFKAEHITIVKDKSVSFGSTSYDHATIGNVTATICAALSKHGFSHRWDTRQDGESIAVTCIITHRQGHSETTTLAAGADKSGGKNSIQSIASTVTYLQRYTLLAATGLATHDQQDDDGSQSEPNSLVVDLCAAVDAAADLHGLKAVKANIADCKLTPSERQHCIAAYNARLKSLSAAP